MSGMQKQWAVRLPDGSLWTQQRTFLMPSDNAGKPYVYDSEEDARRAADALRSSARQLGVTDLPVTLVSRSVSAWSGLSVDAESSALVRGIEEHLAAQVPDYESVDQAEEHRNRVYADPSSDVDDRLRADLDFAAARNRTKYTPGSAS